MAEREDVLKVEFVKVDDEWSAGQIVHQNEKVFKRGEFRDEELNILSLSSPGFFCNKLYIRGTKKYYDKVPFHIKNEDIEKLKEKIEKLNNKYGIKKWRADTLGRFYWISPTGEIKEDKDYAYDFQNKIYKIGNYFRTRKEAVIKRDKILKILEELKDLKEVENC